MDVSIIIVNYNTINLLCNAIDSVIQKTTKLIYEIIVVDNNSNDNSKQIINDKYSENIKYISLSKNIGFGRANNEGIHIAKGRNIFLLNPDTILQNNAVKILSDYLDSNLGVAVVGGNLYNANGTPQASFSCYYPSISHEVCRLFNLCLNKRIQSFNYSDIPQKVITVYGAALMIKKTVIAEVGGFDSRFFMYAEEDELCHRIKKRGYSIINVPQSQITHLDGRSFEFTEERQKRRLQGLRTLYKVSYSPIYCIALRVIEYSMIISRLFLFSLLANNEKIKLWKFYYKNRKW